MEYAKRVYCDMATLKDFMYVGETNKNLNKFEHEGDLTNLKNECYSMGMAPLKFLSISDVTML